MARRSATGKQEQAKRTRAAAARTGGKRKGKAAAKGDEEDVATSQDVASTTEPSSDLPEASQGSTVHTNADNNDTNDDDAQEHAEEEAAPKSPARKTTSRSPRKPRGKGKQKAVEPDVQEPEEVSHDTAAASSSRQQDSSMQSSMDSEAEVAAAVAAQAIAQATDDDVKASSSTFDEKASGLYMLSPSSGKATPARQKRRLNSRTASSPYGTSDASRTPKSSRGTDAEEAQRQTSPEAQSLATMTPRPNKTRSARLSQAAAQSPRSPAMRALQSIAGLLSPWRSSRAQQSAAFGHIEDDVEEEEVAEDIIPEARASRSSPPALEEQVEPREEPKNEILGTSEAGEADIVQPDNEAAAAASQDNDDEPPNEATQSIYPTLPSAPIAAPAMVDETVIVNEATEHADSPDATKTVEIVDEPVPQVEQEEVPDVSFGSVSRDDDDDDQDDDVVITSVTENEPQEAGSPMAVIEEEVHLPSVPHSPPHSPAIVSVHSSMAMLSPPLSQPQRHDTPKSEFGVGFGSSTPFAVAQNGFGARASYSPLPAPAQTAPDVFSFGRQRDNRTPQMPAYPRPTIANKSSSPLAKNYELLSRFFAEKAAAEATGDTSWHGDESGESAHALGGLTEVELAGCMRLIEQSFAQGQGAEVERLRSEAIERGGFSVASSSAGGPSTSIRRANGITARMSRSPSLPLGAAADELPLDYDIGIRSRPSTSFLAPTNNFGGRDQAIGRSLANAFGPTSAAPQRRHRPLYLGPGVGAGVSPSDALRRSQLAQQRRAALQTHRRVQQEALVAASEKDAHVEAAPKRRRLQDGNTGESRAQPLRPAASAKAEAAPSLFHKSAVDPNTQRSQQSANLPPATPPPQRSLTADAMLSILRSSPSIPSRNSGLAGSGSAALNGQKQTLKSRPTNPELVNPYESDHRRVTKRASIAPSSSLVAKEKERLKEERERRQREMLERKNAKKESTLELIERTAPLPRRSGRRIRLEPEDEEEEEGAREASSSAEAPVKTAPTTSTAQEDRDRKTKEVQKRLDSLKANKAQQSAASTSQAPASAASTIADKPKDAPATTPTASAATLKPFAFGTSAAAFAPKKPSPLSQAANNVLDSPSTASEASVDHDVTNRTSAASPSKPVPTPSFALGASTEKATQPASSAATPKPAFSFTNPAATSAAAPKPASQPLFSFSSASKPASGAPTVTSPASDDTIKTTATPREQAQGSAASSLPKYDFSLSVLEAGDSSSEGSQKDKDQALAAAKSTLPSFNFFEGSSEASAPTETPVTKPAFSFLPAPGSTAGPASGSGFSFKPIPPAESKRQAHDESENDASHDSQATGGETISDKSTSALLSGVGEGEEEESTMHEVRCKIWSLESGKWNDLGIGSLKLKKHQTTDKRRVLVRNEGNGKVTVNFRILPTFKPNLDKNVVSFLGFTAEGKPMNYRCKIKTEDSARSLKEAMEREAASAT